MGAKVLADPDDLRTTQNMQIHMTGAIRVKLDVGLHNTSKVKAFGQQGLGNPPQQAIALPAV